MKGGGHASRNSGVFVDLVGHVRHNGSGRHSRGSGWRPGWLLQTIGQRWCSHWDTAVQHRCITMRLDCTECSSWDSLRLTPGRVH